jgi:hypothetical protein
MGTLKLLALMLIAGGAVYFLCFSDFKWSQKQGGLQRQKEPTITFVPKGTPGAKTFEEWQNEQRLKNAPRR